MQGGAFSLWYREAAAAVGHHSFNRENLHVPSGKSKQKEKKEGGGGPCAPSPPSCMDIYAGLSGMTVLLFFFLSEDVVGMAVATTTYHVHKSFFPSPPRVRIHFPSLPFL